ncbi:MAG: sulfate reduction electron transfer complex DsrMKJOP subunit DsrM [Polyangiaceae bacterium]|nr:sulfate reduction electron transfer complex DsrMKJOP subunit DsrM [Polyangiaceae bacterium]
MSAVVPAARQRRTGAFGALVAVAALCAIALAAAFSPGAGFALTIVLPYAAVAIFVGGIVLRVLRWGRAPVPFRIPTTCGQQRSLPWLTHQPLENPSGTLGVVGRMVLEVLLFRSLFRNTRSQMGPDRRLLYFSEKWLWLGAIAFHASLCVVLIRHLRFFLDPVPRFVGAVQAVDGFFQIGLPEVFLSSLGICAGLLYLTYRRFADPQVRYLSLAADYFPLFLLLGIAATGILMRHFVKTDVVAIKALMVGLVTFHPQALQAPSPTFLVHLTLVSALLIYFPQSKLTHMVGVFLSPTRNLANNSRVQRHVNPWNPVVKTHTYEEWEEEFHEKLKAASIPFDHPGVSEADAKPTSHVGG